DANALAAMVARQVIVECEQAIAERGVFHWVLAGGNTPKKCYQLLRDAELDWSRVHIWFGDERCLPFGDAERNDTMADEALLSHVPVDSSHIHRIHTELCPEKAAEAYADLLADTPSMDLILLGMGEDGHTASLFPGNPALSDKRLAVPVSHAPKPPPERVSMGYSVLNQARKRIVMAAGEGKRDALQRIRQGELLPVARLAACEWYVDEAASS
ncbi:MAG: 6-phosphogluconolactonase, partial [Mariprofundaceae bacterium]|nr:6-phosphogluconolactonase [Mariprofundaceae bacterium]